MLEFNQGFHFSDRAMEIVSESSNSKVQCEMIAKAPRSNRSLPFQSATSCSKDHNTFTSEGQPPASVPSPRKGIHDDEDRVSIGSKQIPKAAESNTEEITNLDETVEEEIDVDPRYHYVFFHNRAKLIRNIFRKSGGVHIHFPPAGSNSSKVLLTGAKKFVNKAKRTFSEVEADLESYAVIECVIPHQHHGSLIGLQGVNVRALFREYSVYIKFPENRAGSSAAGVEMSTVNHGDKERSEATDPRDLIFIRGKEEENCLKAREALLDLVPRVIRVDVPFRYHPAIVGKGGKRVRFMCNKYRVWIKIPHPTLRKNCVYVRGPASNCEQAKVALLKRIEQLQDGTRSDFAPDGNNASAPRATFVGTTEVYWLKYVDPSFVLGEL